MIAHASNPRRCLVTLLVVSLVLAPAGGSWHKGSPRVRPRLCHSPPSPIPSHAWQNAGQPRGQTPCEILEGYPDVVECAREAIRRSGLTVVERAIRGGTDGSRLSFMGLPTRNLFAGEHNFHSRLEWVSGQDMDKAVETIVNLRRVWEEQTVAP